jgi:hypothetical protein
MGLKMHTYRLKTFSIWQKLTKIEKFYGRVSVVILSPEISRAKLKKCYGHSPSFIQLVWNTPYLFTDV